MSDDPGADVALNLPALGRALRDRGIVVEGRLDGSRVGLGQSNLTYLVEDDKGARWIARRPPRGHLLASAHDVAREARILSALADTSVPVPLIVAVIDDPAVCESVVVVMEHVAGIVVDRTEVAESLTGAVREAISKELPRAMAEVHAVDLEHHGLSTLASHAPYAARQLRTWTRQWEATRLKHLPALDRLTDLLARAVPVQRSVALVHGDLHLRNIIVESGTGSIRALLDWELSTLGDPLADVGTMLAYWLEDGDPPTGLFEASSLPGFLSRESLVGEYCEASGTNGRDVAYWHALGLWKVAIIVAGVHRRARDEPAAGLGGGPAEAVSVEQIVHQALDVLTAAGVRT